MAFCTKLNFATWLSPSGLRLQKYSTGHEANGSTKNRSDKLESIKNSQFKGKSYSCSKNRVNEICFVSGAEAKHMEYLFSKWIKNVNSVHKSWHHYFSEFIESQSKIQKLKSSVQSKVSLNTLSSSQETGSFSKIEKFNPKSKLTVIVASNGSNNWPPLSPQEQNCVVGHINLSPFSDNESSSRDALNKLINAQDLIRNTSKPPNKTDKNVNKKRLEKKEHLQNMKRIKRILDRKDFNAGRNDIKEQPEILEENKSLERKLRESSAGIVVKKSKEPEKKITIAPKNN